MFTIYYYCRLCNKWLDEDYYGSLWGAIAFAIGVQVSRMTQVWVGDEYGNRLWPNT